MAETFCTGCGELVYAGNIDDPGFLEAMKAHECPDDAGGLDDVPAFS